MFDLFDDDDYVDDFDDDVFEDDDYEDFSFNPINLFFNEDEPNVLEQLKYYIDNGFNFDEGSYGEYLTEYLLNSKKLAGYIKYFVICMYPIKMLQQKSILSCFTKPGFM